ncbi:type II secretion system F family protein [Pararoseomonas indoligenes]|uniref:Type II secretion system F family protein n=1 Tax=Roseomonas indoligenes TaxID=2820811 RepID=A0A940S871_9PROT|nr:type II secretion system F family protein [Pararoseomonas indoligenes]
MRHAPLLLVTGILLAALLLGILALVEARRARRLRERVLEVAGAAPVALAVPAPSIRMHETERSPLQLRLLRLVSFDPDLTEAEVIPWPLVAAISATGGLFATWRLSGMLGTPLAFVAGMLCTVLLARALFKWQKGRYQDAVIQQLPDALGLMLRAIRAGLPLAEAMRGIAQGGASPIREEFTRVVGEVAIGRPVDAALMRVYARTGLTEFSFLAVTLGLQAQTGGSLAETLETLADMVRKRVAMAKRAKALAAEGRMQAGMLFVLPFLAAAGMSFIQPFYLRTFIENPTGQRLALIGFGLMLLGLFTIRHLIRQAGRD